jgi:hypothetical protein
MELGNCKFIVNVDITFAHRLQHDGQATVFSPPNTESFDPKKCQASLRPRNTSNASLTTPVSASSDLSPVASFLSSLTGFMSTVIPSAPHRPQTPDHFHAHSNFSPHVDTPTKLHRYLTYAENLLGVKSALKYESLLERESYGPDILDQLPDEVLTSIGMPRGDVIRLKRGCEEWWKLERSSKRRRMEEIFSGESHTPRSHSGKSDTPGSSGQSENFKSVRKGQGNAALGSSVSGSHRIDGEGEGETSAPVGGSDNIGIHAKDPVEFRYEIIFPDGGGSRYYGPAMRPGNSTPADSRTRYLNSALDAWLPVPAGFCAPAYNTEGREGLDNIFFADYPDS